MAEVSTQVTEVVVYPDRARVTRVGHLAVDLGELQVHVGELSRLLDPDSVRVAARGTADAQLFGVDVRPVFYSETPEEKVREIEEAIEGLEDELQAVDRRIERFEREQAALDDLVGQGEAFARGLALGKTTAESQMALFDAARARGGAIDRTVMELSVQRREKNRQLEKLRRELGQLQGGGERERYEAVVDLRILSPGDLTFELTYVVANAAWKPLYDVRWGGEGETAGVEIGYLAQIQQRTGEAWDDVKVSLSTARPALSDTLPELDPWYVRPLPPPRPMRAQRKMAAPPPGEATQGAEPEMAMAAVPEPREAQEVVATVDLSGASVTYRIPTSVTIPSDGAPHKVTVARFDVPVEIDYVVASKLVEAAYRRAEVENESDYTLLPGAANVFYAGQYVGSTELDLVAPQESFDIYLGTEDRIRVKRELELREVDKRLIRDRRQMRYGYEIEVENLTGREVKAVVTDQIPVSKHENVKVKLDRADPEPSERTELNLLTWELSLTDGEKRTIRFDFTVEAPRDMRLVGLP